MMRLVATFFLGFLLGLAFGMWLLHGVRVAEEEGEG